METKWLKVRVAIGVLLITTMACYTPWQKAQTEKTAIARLALLEGSIYVPPATISLAEFRSSAQHNVDAGASISWIYLTPYSCEELIAEYRKAMEDSGWTMGSIYDCDGELWLRMINSYAGFSIGAAPPEESPHSEEWRRLREQHAGKGLLYYVEVTVVVDYDE